MKKLAITCSATCLLTKQAVKYLGCVAGQISTHKFWEIEHYFDPTHIFHFGLAYRTACDHAGIEMSISLLFYTIRACIYDDRHLDHHAYDLN